MVSPVGSLPASQYIVICMNIIALEKMLGKIRATVRCRGCWRTHSTARVIVIPRTCRTSLAPINCLLALLLSEGESVRASALFHLVPPCGKKVGKFCQRSAKL